MPRNSNGEEDEAQSRSSGASGSGVLTKYSTSEEQKGIVCELMSTTDDDSSLEKDSEINDGAGGQGPLKSMASKCSECAHIKHMEEASLIE